MSESRDKNRTFVKGAVILGAAGLTIKVLGAFFRIPLTNIIGDEGMGYYQTAYPIYVLFLTLATAGIPIAISRMVAERNAVGKRGEAHRVFRTSFILLLGIGVFSSSFLFFGAGKITEIIKEPMAAYSMRAIAPALFFVPLMAAFRGYFQGRQNMTPTAVSQIVEQLFRVGVGLFLAVYFLPKGLPIAAAGASFGATAGGIFGFLSIVAIYVFYGKGREGFILPTTGQETEDHEQESRLSILKTLLIIAVPITIGASVMPIINAIDTGMVRIRLMDIGYSPQEARSLYGQLTGMAAPLINLPQVLTQAVSMSVVPVIASAKRRGDLPFMQRNIALALRYALILSIPAAVGMSVLAKPIMLLLYPLQRESAANAAPCLSILAVGIAFLATVQALTGILQGIGKQHIPVINLFIGSAVKIVFTYVLTGIHFINVLGPAIGTVSAYAIAAALNFIAVKKYTGTDIDTVLTFGKPLFCAGAMGAVCVVLQRFVLEPILGGSLSTLVAIACGGVVYVVLVLRTGTITEEELTGLPKGDMIVRLLKVSRLLPKS